MRSMNGIRSLVVGMALVAGVGCTGLPPAASSVAGSVGSLGGLTGVDPNTIRPATGVDTRKNVKPDPKKIANGAKDTLAKSDTPANVPDFDATFAAVDAAEDSALATAVEAAAARKRAELAAAS